MTDTPADTPAFAPKTDADVRRLVRTLTQYDDTDDELPTDTLQQQLEVAKLRLYNRVGSDEFYTDAGLGQALIAATAILSKAAVENHSIARFEVADIRVEMDSTGSDDDERQYHEWAQMMERGIDRSDATPTSGPSNTASYIG